MTKPLQVHPNLVGSASKWLALDNTLKLGNLNGSLPCLAICPKKFKDCCGLKSSCHNSPFVLDVVNTVQWLIDFNFCMRKLSNYSRHIFFRYYIGFQRFLKPRSHFWVFPKQHDALNLVNWKMHWSTRSQSIQPIYRMQKAGNSLFVLQEIRKRVFGKPSHWVHWNWTCGVS